MWKDNWMVSIDLKDAYLSVPIYQDHSKYLRDGTTYEFQCLPFGLRNAPRVFTKLLKPVMAIIRQNGLRSLIFLDDMQLIAESRQILVRQTKEVLLLGFRINWEKSSLTPTHMITYLGFVIDSTQMRLTLLEKVQRIVRECQTTVCKESTSVRSLSRLIGRMSVTVLAVLPAPLCYRSLQARKNRALADSQSFDTIVTLTTEAKMELTWWVQMMREWNGRPSLPPAPDLIIETDASLLRWGAFSEQGRTGGLWSLEERKEHINVLELVGGVLATKTLKKAERLYMST